MAVESEPLEVFTRFNTELLSDIVGYDDIKEYLAMAFRTPDPISILFVGPPASAKSLILDALEQIGGRLVVGSKTTKAGLIDILVNEKPGLLLYDEIDKAPKPVYDLSPLLTWIQDGRVKSDTKDEKIDIRINSSKWMVVAAANRITKIPPEILSRFDKFFIKEYTKEQFTDIVCNLLVRKESLEKPLAKYIATYLISQAQFDIREALRIAKLVKHEPDPYQATGKVIRIKNKYR